MNLVPLFKWKQSNSEKTARDRNQSSRSRTFEEPIHGPSISKHPMNSRIGKTSRALSTENVRLKNPPEPPEPTLGKKKTKDRDIDKVCYRSVNISNLITTKIMFL